MWAEPCDDTIESGARMLVIVEEGCEGGTGGGGGGGWSCSVNCVRGAWERVGAGRGLAASGTPVNTQKFSTCILYIALTHIHVHKHY